MSVLTAQDVEAIRTAVYNHVLRGHNTQEVREAVISEITRITEIPRNRITIDTSAEVLERREFVVRVIPETTEAQFSFTLVPSNEF